MRDRRICFLYALSWLEGLSQQMKVQNMSVNSTGPTLGGVAPSLAAPKALTDGILMLMPAPVGVPTPLWTLAGPTERRILLAQSDSWTAAAGVAQLATAGRQLSSDLTLEQLRAIMPAAGEGAAGFLGPLNTAMRAHGIDTPAKQAAFLAHVAVESQQLRNTSENLNYSAKRLTEVWPRRFPTLASARPYAHNPEKLANHVYANRNGNGNEASGDGWRYRGGGLMQATGRANYRAIGMERTPERLRNPVGASDSAAAFWESHGLNRTSARPMNRTAFDATTRTVNGGLNGASDRWAAYGRAVVALHVR